MANCCRCQTGPTPPVCRSVITSADLAELVYVAGLDEDLCEKFELVEDFLNVCEQLAELEAGDPVVLGVTELVGIDCLTHVVPETVLTVVDTNCIDLTAGGSFGHTLTAALVISPDAGNQAVCTANGLLVAAAADICDELAVLPYMGVAVPGVTKIVANDCNVYDLPAGVDAITIVGADGDCLDLTAVQAPAGTWTVSGDVVISPNADNAISCLGNGLFVADVSIVGQDTACIDIEVVEGPGNNDFTITIDPIISGAEGNILECTPEGLYVPGLVDFNVVDTDCFDFTVTNVDGVITLTGEPIISPVVGNALACSELGLFVTPGGEADPVVITGIDTNCIEITIDNPVINEWEITVTPVIDPALDNVLECTVDGLYVPASAAFALTAVDTSCANITVTPTGPSAASISVVPIVADTYPGYPAACNPLLCTVDGLTVPPEHTGLNFDIGDITETSGPLVEGGLRLMTGTIVDITNPSPCRYMAFSIITRIPEVHHHQDSLPVPGKLVTYIRIDHEFAFPTAFPAPIVFGPVLKTEWWLNTSPPEAGDTAAQRFGNSNPGGSIVNLIVLPPGGTGTYTVSGLIVQEKNAPSEVTNAGIVVRVQGQTI